jgi:hypothetical protein
MVKSAPRRPHQRRLPTLQAPSPEGCLPGAWPPGYEPSWPAGSARHARSRLTTSTPFSRL